MAKPNYAFEKRQKEIAKKQKKQEKLNQKSESKEQRVDDDQQQPAEPDSGSTPANPVPAD